MSVSTANVNKVTTLLEKDPTFKIPYLYLNTASSHYSFLKKYFKDGMVVVTSHREPPTVASIPYDKNIRYGCWYGYGHLEEFGDQWSKWDVQLIRPISNDEIIRALEIEVRQEGLTLEEALKEVDEDVQQLVEAFNLPDAYL